MTKKRKHKKPENHLAAVEAATEGNYNMIDGCINNEPPPKDDTTDAKPSILAQLHRLEDTDTPRPNPHKEKHNLER